MVVNGVSAIPLPNSPRTGVLTLGTLTMPYTQDPASPSLLTIGSQTLTVGGPAATISGQTVSAGPGDIVVNGISTLALPVSPRTSLLTLGTLTMPYTQDPASPNLLTIGSQTLTVGGPPATISGQTVSAGPGDVVVDGTSTIALTDLAMGTGGATTGIGGIIVSMFGPWKGSGSGVSETPTATGTGLVGSAAPRPGAGGGAAKSEAGRARSGNVCVWVGVVVVGFWM